MHAHANIMLACAEFDIVYIVASIDYIFAHLLFLIIIDRIFNAILMIRCVL